MRARFEPPAGIPLWVNVGAGGFVAAIVAWAVAAGDSSLPLPVQVAVAMCTVVPWAPGIRRPVTSKWFVLASTAPTLLFTWSGGSPVLFGVLALGATRVAVSTTGPRTALYVVAAVGIVVGRQFVAHHDTNWWMWKTYVELGAIAGLAVQRQAMLVVQTRNASSERARLAALEERRRIARDVHDVLAHTLTILMVHLNSARLSLHEDPDGTAAVLDEAAAHGRRCLDEIRRTVGLLSEPDPTEKAVGPIDAANAIEELVATYRNVGVEVDLRLDVEMAHMGLLTAAPAAVWNTGYRIVQESLANATKHAPGASVDCAIGVDDSGLHVVCVNALRPDVAVLELPKGGNGLDGMRERVETAGGTFSAGPQGGAWVVRADIPLANDGARHRASATLGRAS